MQGGKYTINGKTFNSTDVQRDLGAQVHNTLKMASLYVLLRQHGFSPGVLVSSHSKHTLVCRLIGFREIVNHSQRVG